MKINFKNHTDCDIRLCIEGKTLIIPASADTEYLIEGKQAEFSVCQDELSKISYLSKKGGVILKKDFTVLSTYSINSEGECTVNLFFRSKKGRFADSYRRILALCDRGTLSSPYFSIFDEQRVRDAFASSQKNGNRALLLFDFFDILGNVFTALLVLLVPFGLIWLFGSFETACRVCGILFVPIFIFIIVINRVADKYKRKTWQFLKKKVLARETFKGNESYFSHEYIKEVIEA